MRKQMDLERWERALQWGLAGLMALWAAVPQLTQLLLILMAVDIVMGVIVALREWRFSVGEASKGVTIKLGKLVIVGLMAVLEVYTGDVFQMALVQAASVFYCVPELGSIVRHAAVLEVPVPPQLHDLMAYFRDKYGNKK